MRNRMRSRSVEYLPGYAGRLMALALVVSTVANGPATNLLGAESSEDARQQMVARGVSYLLTGQAQDGSFSKASGPAITAICLTAMLRNGLSGEQPAPEPDTWNDPKP